MADEHDGVSLGSELLRLDVDLGHQRAGGVDRLEGLAFARSRRTLGATPWAETPRSRPLAPEGLGVDEHSSPGSQLLDHVRVVDDFPTHVDGGAVQLECARDGLHGAIHARAIAAWRGQQQLLGSHHCTV